MENEYRALNEQWLCRELASMDRLYGRDRWIHWPWERVAIERLAERNFYAAIHWIGYVQEYARIEMEGGNVAWEAYGPPVGQPSHFRDTYAACQSCWRESPVALPALPEIGALLGDEYEPLG